MGVLLFTSKIAKIVILIYVNLESITAQTQFELLAISDRFPFQISLDAVVLTKISLYINI